MKAKLQCDIDLDLLQKLEEEKEATNKSKAAIVTDALRVYFEKSPQPDPEPSIQTLPSGVPVRILPSVGTSPAAVMECVKTDASPVVNLDPKGLEEERQLKKLNEQLQAARNAKDYTRIQEEINQITHRQTMRFLGEMEHRTAEKSSA